MADFSNDPDEGEKVSGWFGLIALLGAGSGIVGWAYLGWDVYFIESFVLAGVLGVGFIALVVEFIRALWKG